MLKSQEATRTRSDWALEFYSQYFKDSELTPDAQGECSVSCPFPHHGKGLGDRNKSMSVNLSTGEFNCLAPTCKGGTEYDFYCQMNDIAIGRDTFNQVMNLLEDELGIRPESVTSERGYGGDRPEPDDKFIEMSEVNDRVNRLWTKYPREIEFLQFMRGLDEETIKRFKLGYKPADDRISIPIFDEHGRCVNIRSYSRKDPLNKIISYGAGYGKGRLYPIENLYNGEEDVLLVEGEFDALVAIQKGFNAVTTTLGAGNWKSSWNELFEGKNVIICYDNDDAGTVGAEKVGKHLVKRAKSVRLMDMGKLVSFEGGDITDFFVEGGGQKEQFLDAMASARPFTGLEYDDKGKLYKSEHNIEVILTTGAFDDKFHFNEFSKTEMVKGDLPWRDVDGFSQWTDNDDANLRHYMGLNFGLRNITTMLTDAITKIAYENTFHPIKQFIESEKWDGQRRIGNIFIDYLGAEDTDYVKAVTELFMVASVARIYKPGIKFDYMPVLVGKQGIGKSYLVEILTGHRWFSVLDNFGGKDALEKLQESWIFEVAELEAFKKSEEREIKSFLTTTNDKFRASYGKRVEEHPRTCTFIGSTNEREFLTDPTGNRRFLPVVCQRERGVSPDFRVVESNVGQFWAEALHLWKRGYVLELPRKLQKVALQMQEEQYSKDPWEDIVEAYINKKSLEEIAIPELWFKALGGTGEKVARYHTERIKKCLERVGFYKGDRKRTDYGTVPIYYKEVNMEEEDAE